MPSSPIVAAILLLALLWVLYRRERRDLSRARRGVLVGLRVLTLLAVAAMLVEPVLIFTRRETVRSHLALILDDSESMTFSDPYTDDSRAVEIAAALRLPSEGGRSPMQRLRETPRLDLVKTALRPNLDALARGRDLYLYDLESAARKGPGGRSGRGSSTRSSRSGRCLRWAMRSRACWRRTGASRSPAWSWRPTGGRTRGRTRSAPWRRRSARTSRSTRSPPGPTRGRGTSASPRSRPAPSSSPATR